MFLGFGFFLDGTGSSIECVCLNVDLWIFLRTAEILVLNKGDLRSTASFLGVACRHTF